MIADKTAHIDKYKILLVDDEPIQRMGIRDFINEQSYPFRVEKDARNGQEALEYLKDHEIDIVVTDVNMPLKDGLSLAQESMKINPLLVFVFISGYQEFHYVHTAVKLDAVDYLLKPIEPHDLVTALYKAIDKVKNKQLMKTLGMEDESEDKQTLASLLKDEIQQNYRDFPSLQELAERYMYSEAQLSTVFKRDFGMTISQYLTKVRLEKACYLLEHTDRFLYEIADDVGYKDMKYFRALFKREKGISPSDWRTRHKKEQAGGR